jgi:glutathione S-transferase
MKPSSFSEEKEAKRLLISGAAFGDVPGIQGLGGGTCPAYGPRLPGSVNDGASTGVQAPVMHASCGSRNERTEMFKLYDYLPSQNGWKIRVLLGMLKIPYESRNVSIFEGESRTGAFLALNPAGAIPVLELENGLAIAESNAILVYLAEGTPLFAPDRYGRAKIMQWLFFEQYHVEPTIGSLRFWTLTGRLEQNHALVSRKREAASHALAALDRSLLANAFLAGKTLSVADIAVYAYSHLAGDCGFRLADYPAMRAWAARVSDAIGSGYPVHPYGIDRHSDAPASERG